MSSAIRRIITIGARGSALALAQTELVAAELRRAHPGVDLEVHRLSTAGDRDRLSPLERIGGQGVFVKEIELALLSGEIDLAVHSLKDMPSVAPPGLSLAAILPREDPRDALVSRHGLTLMELPWGAHVGTGSPRRRAQLLAVRPDLQVVELRGNVDTRLRKAQGEDYDGIVLAVAGLKRLGRAGGITEVLAPEVMLPAVGQGAIAIQARADDGDVLRLVAPLDDTDTRAAVVAERALLRQFGAGCRLPIAAYGMIVDEDSLWLRAAIGEPSGAGLIRAEVTGPKETPEELGQRLGARLIDRGARAAVREA